LLARRDEVVTALRRHVVQPFIAGIRPLPVVSPPLRPAERRGLLQAGRRFVEERTVGVGHRPACSPQPLARWSAWTFYVGRLKGVGAVWQLTAVDVATRTAVCPLVVGDKTASVVVRFLDHLKKALHKHGITLAGVLTDKRTRVCRQGLQGPGRGVRVGPSLDPPRSPNHNTVCERFHGTVLHEFYRPHFYLGRVEGIGLLDRSLRTWLVDYNQHRPNHGDYMRRAHPLAGQEGASPPHPADCRLRTNHESFRDAYLSPRPVSRKL
jgi:transposase InsO family protein